MRYQNQEGSFGSPLLGEAIVFKSETVYDLDFRVLQDLVRKGFPQDMHITSSQIRGCPRRSINSAWTWKREMSGIILQKEIAQERSQRYMQYMTSYNKIRGRFA